ncbi:MAG: NAD-dependent epimerase/dehydratase family protein [Deltaproteobacteria bacterium]|nr:NAD-dependent epimerase/dehydratase family protein [Deltaproteobacteria bacterium]
MARYLVTGGAGFIGSNLVKNLLRRGEEVTVLDDFSTGKRSNLHPALERIRLVAGSLLDEAALEQSMSEVDFVLHLAAIASVQRSFDDPLLCLRTNSEGTLRLLLAARRHGVRRVVVASSSAVYGDDPRLPKREDMAAQPISLYGLTKLDGEIFGRLFSGELGVEVVCLRYFNVFGPHQDPASEYAAVIPCFLARMLRGVPPIIYGDGGQSRDFCYVDNVAQANLLACHAPQVAGRVINIASGEQVDLLALVTTLNELLGTRLEPRHEPARHGDIRHSSADVQLARELLGYRAETSFIEGLRRTVAWYEEQTSPARAGCPTP